MPSAKRYLVIALSFVLALTIFAICAPRAVHAVTATLVQIVNTYANPVPTARADDPGRNPVSLHFGATDMSAGSYFVQDVLQDAAGNPYDVPAGKRLVLDSASVFAFPPAGQKVYAHLYASNTNSYAAIPPVALGNFGSSDYLENTVPIRLYVNPGGSLSFTVWRSASTSSMQYRVDVSGYLVDCTNGGGC